MRSATKVAITMVAFTAAAGLISGCTSGGTSGDDGDGIKIGFILRSQTQPRSKFEAEAFKAESEKLGNEVIIQYGEDSGDVQAEQVRAMISQGVDVLVLSSADIQVGGTLIEQAKRSGVKTIAYDVPVEGGTPDLTISRRQAQVGELQMEAALAAVPQGNYAILNGDYSSVLSQESERVYHEFLDGKSGINIVYDDFIAAWDTGKSRQIAENVLTRNNDAVDVMVANSDTQALGVVQALEGRGLAGKVFVTGLDADVPNLKLIAEGKQNMTVWTPIDEMAVSAATAADKLGKGEEPEVSETVDGAAYQYVQMSTIDKDNLCEFVTETAPEGWVSIEQVFSDPNACS